MSDSPTITVNGVEYPIGDVSPTYRLVDFLFDNYQGGAHSPCREGGCGACTIVATVTDPATGDKVTASVYSCLVPLLACAGWEITTVEGLGNSYDGFHVIQDRLAERSGAQCGYCSPGMVMNMYSLTQKNPSWTALDIERHLDGSICRCTGYRPILDAFKSITVKDIEDSHIAVCPKTGQSCKGHCAPASGTEKKCEKGQQQQKEKSKLPRTLQVKGATWHQPQTLQELYETLSGLPEGAQYRLVCGDTGHAVWDDGPFTDFIYTRHIPEMCRVVQEEESVVFGASVSISRVMEELDVIADSRSGYAYGKEIVKAWRHLGSTSLRNLGSWGGNIALRVAHKDFPSDVFIALLGAGATITTADTNGITSRHSLEELLDIDLQGQRRIILEMRLPPIAEDVTFRIFKVLPRYTNSKCYVNAAFKLQVDTANAHTVTGDPVIVYGGISPDFIHAAATEAVLVGKSLEDDAVIQSALNALASEMTPVYMPEEASPEYRLALTQTMLYKTVLGIVGDVADSDMISGASDVLRPVSSGQQTFDPNSDIWPLGQPIPKLDSHILTSGEAEFVSTIPTQPQELCGRYVTSTHGNARIVSIDPSPALAIPGVVDFVGVDDITGVNNFMVMSSTFPEPIFASDRVSYYGQPLGVIIARDRDAAIAGVSAVKVTYDDIKTPVLTIEEASKLPPPDVPLESFVKGDVEAGFAASTHIIEGAMSRGGQFHFSLECQVTLAIPKDDGFEIHCSSQWATETQRAIGQVLGIPDNEINVIVKRLGGAFGSKINRCNIVATAAALAARKVRKPVRIQLDLKDNMNVMGGRDPFFYTYKVGVDDAGVLKAVQATVTCDAGYTASHSCSPLAAESFPNCYTCDNWEITPKVVETNTANNTWCRTPGTTAGVMFMENIMEHLAVDLGQDPLQLRRKNLLPDGGVRRVDHTVLRDRLRTSGPGLKNFPVEVKIKKNLLPDMIDQIMVSAQVDQRKVLIDQFNKSNKWKKRGLSVMPLLWPYAVPLNYPFNVLVSINARDGSVAISHGGSEMGQGIHTRVAQCAAYELGIPLDLISVHPTTTHTNANTECSSGSCGSNFACYSVSEACKKLKTRLDDFKATLEDPNMPWSDFITLAYHNGIDLSERYVNAPDEVKGYSVFAVAVSEVELDVLNGHFVIVRTDILEDAGRSLSPLLDVGQVEGGFIYGQGLVTSEKLVYDPTSGKQLTDSTWTYKPLLAQDIPLDLRVTLLHDAPNPTGVLSSKITQEPPVCLSYSVAMALRQAVTSAREDGGFSGWFAMDAPLTVEALQLLCLVNPSRLTLSSSASKSS